MTTDIDTFTLDELLTALQGAQVAPDATHGAVRMAELVELTGMNDVALAKRLRRLMEQGRVEHVRVPFQRLDGVWTKSPAYRLVNREE